MFPNYLELPHFLVGPLVAPTVVMGKVCGRNYAPHKGLRVHGKSKIVDFHFYSRDESYLSLDKKVQ